MYIYIYICIYIYIYIQTYTHKSIHICILGKSTSTECEAYLEPIVIADRQKSDSKSSLLSLPLWQMNKDLSSVLEISEIPGEQIPTQPYLTSSIGEITPPHRGTYSAVYAYIYIYTYMNVYIHIYIYISGTYSHKLPIFMLTPFWGN
jgi:hypothetical protein